MGNGKYNIKYKPGTRQQNKTILSQIREKENQREKEYNSSYSGIKLISLEHNIEVYNKSIKRK